MHSHNINIEKSAGFSKTPKHPLTYTIDEIFIHYGFFKLTSTSCTFEHYGCQCTFLINMYVNIHECTYIANVSIHFLFQSFINSNHPLISFYICRRHSYQIKYV